MGPTDGGPYREGFRRETSPAVTALVTSWQAERIARPPASAEVLSRAEHGLCRPLPPSLATLLSMSNGSEMDVNGIRFWSAQELDREDDLVLFADRDRDATFYAVDSADRVVLVSQRNLPIARTFDALVERYAVPEQRAALFLRSGGRTGRVLTRFERDALRVLIDSADAEPFRAALLAQLDVVEVQRRQRSAKGLSTGLHVEEPALHIARLPAMLAVARVRFPRTGFKGELVLWTSRGRISRLEGSSFDPPWRDDEDYEFTAASVARPGR